MRVFYVIHPNEVETQSWLNILRFLADPHAKYITHLTVRGPYTQRYDLSSASNSIQGHRLHVIGADAFWGATQATALLRCAPDEKLHKIWHKPSYPDFIPHFSICDGKPEIYTKRVLQIIEHIKPFAFHSTGLLPMITKPPMAEISLRSSIDFRKLGQLLGDEFDEDKVNQSDEHLRLKWLAQAVRAQPCTSET